ncbi:EmrB QacA subfamily drug resistance transporter [Levilactobacillus koreensis JCM 16448]|uniref:DSBA oxidoreductase n=1 Tax=Levilactobacillus koreensis TaxID=637971 RepID=A0AAC8UWP7_9LACO|nr:DHA2 family efflux MFS transporter permease subunit [Levilactobacillus koreensis]AKP64849.1 DSBA oxidoreductase [Levilactobacillus koreensis]KRK85931.1 EmrB QacA subfamily drug resistance transporter [Levilactobacillus koreensis JCM 16448]
MSKEIKQSLFIMVFGTFFGILCSTLMNVALPTFMTVFHVNSSTVQWISNGYMLVSAMMIPVSAYLTKKYTFRALFITFSVIFLAGTLLGSIAQSFFILILGRMIQAIGSGVMMPLVNILAIRYAEPTKKGAVMGIVGLAFNFSPIIGPTLSGVILTYLSWRYLFILVLPFIIIDIGLALRSLPRVPTNETPKLDGIGLILVSFGSLGLLWSFSNVGQYTLTSPFVLVPFAVGLLFTALFIRQQIHTANPLINLQIFKNVQFTTATSLNALIVATMYGNTILLPLLIQTIMHQSPIISGLAILPGACLTGVMSPISGRLFDRYPVRVIVTTGLLIDCFGTMMQAFIDVNASVAMLTVGQTVRQLGLVLILIPIQTQALTKLPNRLIADGVATFNTLRQIAGSFGTAIIIATINLATKFFSGHPNAPQIGIQSGFTMCLLFLLIALGVSTKLLTVREVA